MDGEALSIGDDPHAAMMSGSFVQPDIQEASADRSMGLTDASPSPEPAANEQHRAGKEKAAFFDRLSKLGSVSPHGPTQQNEFEQLAENKIDLYKLWKAVQSYGGYGEVIAQKGWAGVGRRVASRQMTDMSTKLRQIYERRLLKLEQAEGELDGAIAIGSPGNTGPCKSRTPTPAAPALTAEIRRKLDAAAARVKGQSSRSAAFAEPAAQPAKTSSKKRPRSPNSSVSNAMIEHSSPRRSSTGESMVGRRIEVWWHDPGEYFPGVIESFQPASQSYAIAYDDGDREDGINLIKEKWRQLPDDSAGPDRMLDPADAQAAPAQEGAKKQKAQQQSSHAANSKPTMPSPGALVTSIPLGISTPDLLPGKRPPYRMIPYCENSGFKYVPPVAVIDSGVPSVPKISAVRPVKQLAAVKQKALSKIQSASKRASQQALKPAPQPQQAAPQQPRVAQPVKKSKPELRHDLPERMRAAAAAQQMEERVQTLPQAPPAVSDPPYTVKKDSSGFDIFCLMPGFSMQEIRVKAWPDGRLKLTGTPGPQREQEAKLWQIHSIDYTIQLPGPVDARSARALYTLSCQLYVRVDRGADLTIEEGHRAPQRLDGDRAM